MCQSCKKLNLKKFIKTVNSYKILKSSDEKILSDACEALIGKQYIWIKVLK